MYSTKSLNGVPTIHACMDAAFWAFGIKAGNLRMRSALCSIRWKTIRKSI